MLSRRELIRVGEKMTQFPELRVRLMRKSTLSKRELRVLATLILQMMIALSVMVLLLIYLLGTDLISALAIAFLVGCYFAWLIYENWEGLKEKKE